MSTKHLIEVRDVSVSFGRFKALSNVSVSFAPNQLTAIIGPNGAGKSTFFNVLSGALPPSQGRVIFEDRDITALQPHDYARAGIAKSLQVTNVFEQLSVHGDVRVAAQMRFSRYGLFKPRSALVQAAEEADALLTRVGLSALRDKTVADLAHGQQRSLEIAMALAADPKLLLMDEPTAGMSPEETSSMMILISQLAKERTVILVEHKMKLVMGICERLIVLHHGELLAQGNADEIRNNSEVRRVYLGQG